MSWTVRIGQGGSIRTQDRVVDVRVTEEFAHQEFVVTIKNPSATDRAQAKGRVDAAIIEIKRGSDTLIEGFIEDIEKEGNTIKYIGRSFLVLTGYTTSSLTDGSSGVTEAEYDDETGATIIDDLLATFCYVNDNELVYTDLTFTEVYGGEVKLHGKKVYDIIRNMCIDYTKDLWADATWTGDDVTAKNIHVGSKSRGSVGAPNKTLYGGIHLKNIPTVKYRSSQNVINRIRVNGKGTGKDKVSFVSNDATSQTTYGVIEGAPYNNNMIVDEATAEAVGDAIIAAKKDLVEEIHVDLIQYLSDLKYGDWVRIVDAYSFVDTTQRIKKITRSYNDQQGEAVAIEVGMPFDNYETLIKDLTKGDVDAEPEMTKLGGAFQLTANDPPSTYVRHDKGDWYDTTGTFQTHGKGVCTFWEYADNPATGTYKKALIQISNAGAVSYKVGSQESSDSAAEGTTVSADALNTPIGEVILKGKAVGGGGYTVEDVYSDDQGDSYIYRDVRPIVGSSSTGYGGDVSNPLTENLAAGGFKITGLGAATNYGDAISLDGDGYVPIAKLPLGGTGLKGGLLVGTETVCSSILPGVNTYVLTADDTETLGMKWAAAGTAGLWEDKGSYVQLIVADDVDFRAKNILHLASLRSNFAAGMTIFDSNGATKAYLGTTSYALKANADIDMNSSYKLKNLAAATVDGDAVRYNEFHAHDIATTGVHGVGANTIEHTGHKGAASGYCGLDADGYIQSVGILAPLTKGNLMVGSATVVTALGVGTNTHVLTLDSTETLGMKWAAAGTAGLWEVDGLETQLIIADDIDMQAYGFIGISSLEPSHVSGTTIFDVNGALRGYLGTTSYAFTAAADINMGSSWKLKNLAAGTVNGDSIRYEQLAAYLPLAGGTMDAAASINMNGGSIEGVYNIEDVYRIYARDTGGDLDVLYIYSDSGTKMAAAITIQSDTTVSASLFGNLSMNSKKITGLAAATVDGDAVRYNEFHAHDIATTGTHGVGANTIEHTGHKGAASGYCGLDVDGYIPSVGMLAPLTKGNLMVGSATVVTALGVGTNTHVLTLDSTEALGMKWAAAGTAGLWEDMGSYVRLIVADDVDFRAKNILHLASLRSNFAAGMTIFDSNGATKGYLGTTSYALKANANIDMNSSYKLKNLAAGAVNGDSIRYDEYSVHTHDSRYYTETETNTWRNSTTQTEMGYLHGITSDIQTQLNGKLSLGGGTMNSEAGINMNAGTLTNVGGISMYSNEDIDMNDGDIDDIDSLWAYDGSGIAIRNSGGTLMMEIGQTTDSFKVYNNVNMNYHDLEQIAYIDGRDNGNLYIRADPDGDSYNTHFEARGYTLFKLGYLDASHPYHIINAADCVASTASYYDLGSSTRKFDDVWCVDLHEGDCCYAETHCAKCGKAFRVGDNITHKVVEICKISGDTKTIPVHAECGSAPLKKVVLQRKDMESYYAFNEESGIIEIRYKKKHEKKSSTKIKMIKGVGIDPSTGKCRRIETDLNHGYVIREGKYYDADGEKVGAAVATNNRYANEVDLKSSTKEHDETTDTTVFTNIEIEI